MSLGLTVARLRSELAGILRLGNIVPDFSANTTQGEWSSFHEWVGDSWCILFSHPADFTPVCTTEIGRLALKYEWFKERNVKVATLSVDPVDSHMAQGRGRALRKRHHN